MTVKIRSGDQRTVNFQKDESAQSMRIRKQGKVLTVMIASGLDKNTDTTPQGFMPGAGNVGRARGGGGAPPTAMMGGTFFLWFYIIFFIYILYASTLFFIRCVSLLF
jgi:hypothetical protein